MALGFFFLNCKGDGVVTVLALYQVIAKFIKHYGHLGGEATPKYVLTGENVCTSCMVWL
jgi:hypothetical protein